MIDDLKRAIAKQEAVVFIGSGVSWATSGSAVAGWKGFLETGIDHCVRAMGSVLPAGWADRQRSSLQNGDLDELLGVAEVVSRKLGAPKGGEFRRWLRESVGALTTSGPGLPQTLGALGVPLITTNYDSLLEDVIARRAITWRQDNLVTRFVQERQLADILHLHGHWEDSESIVLGVRSYETIVGHEFTQSVLRALALSRTLVFVGYGAGLGDPNFEPLRRWAASVLGGTEHRHYRLCLTAEIAGIAGEHSGERIVPLAYGEDYAQLEPFLRQLSTPVGGPTGVAVRANSTAFDRSLPAPPIATDKPIVPAGPVSHAVQRLGQRTRELQELIEAAQMRDQSLALIAARALQLAQQRHDSPIIAFFRLELSGYGETARSTSDPTYPHHRSHLVYCSPTARLNPQHFGFHQNAAAALEHLRTDENFVAVRFVSPEPLSEIEARANAPHPPQSLMSWTQSFGSVFPDLVSTTKIPADASVWCYSSADSYSNVLASIRSEITRRLLSMDEPIGVPLEPVPNALASTWRELVGHEVELGPLYGMIGQPDPDPVFTVVHVTATDLVLRKISNQQDVTLPVASVAAPWGNSTGGRSRARIHTGRLVFVTDEMSWRYRE